MEIYKEEENSNQIRFYKKLKVFSHLKIKSLCSHLAAADDKSKDFFTQHQIKEFNSACDTFTAK